MSESNIFSDEEFAKYQELFNTLSPEEHAMVVQDLIEQLYQYIYTYMKYAKRMKCSDQLNPWDTTSFVNSFTFHLLEKYESKVVEPFLRATAFSQYLRYLQRGIEWFVRNKIIKDNTHFPFVQVPINSETGQELDFPDNFQPDPLLQEICERLVDILNEKLSEDQKELFEMRLGVRFINEDNSIKLISYQPPMTFPEIAEALGGGQTVESLQKRFSRLIDKIKETRAILLFYSDYIE